VSRRVGLRYMQSIAGKKRIPKWKGTTKSRYREGSIMDQPKMAFAHVNTGNNAELLQMAFSHSNVASHTSEALMTFVHGNVGSILAPYSP
jgi:hypothetical protein